MNILENKIEEIKFLLSKVLNDLDLLTEENFDQKFSNAKLNMEQAQQIRSNLIKKHAIEDLNRYNPEIFKITKQIQIKFDNIVEVKKLQINEISLKLKQLHNQAKLETYKR